MADSREVDIIIKAVNETRLVLEEIKREMESLGDSVDRTNRRANESQGPFTRLAGALQLVDRAFGGLMGAIFGPSIALPFLGQTALVLVAAFAAILIPLAGFTVALTALTVTAGVAIGAIGALGVALFALGAGYLGTVNASSEMVKAHHTLDTAIKEHKEALLELQQTQAGVNLYSDMHLTQQERIRIAQQYVAATTNNMNDALHDLRETVRGVNGPLEEFNGQLDDMTHHFEEQSAPFTLLIAQWASGFIPTIRAAGDAVFQWLGPRFQSMMVFATGLVNILMAAFKSTATEIGKDIDFVLAHQPMFLSFFAIVTNAVFGLVNGIIAVSIQISNWIGQNPAMVKSLQNLAEAGVNLVSRAVQGLIEVINGPQGATAVMDPWEKRLSSSKDSGDGLAKAITRISDNITAFMNSKSTKDFYNFWKGIADFFNAASNYNGPFLGPKGPNTGGPGGGPALNPSDNSFHGWMPQAAGLDYVPYDNYPALLHRGERVQTAKEAAGGGGGPTIVQYIYGHLMTERQTLLWARDGIRRLNMGQT